MTVLILLSTVTFTVTKRYCNDDLVDITVFSKFEDCCDEETKNTTIEASNKKCCIDKIEIIEGQQLVKNSFFDNLDSHEQLALFTFVYSYTNLFEGLSQHIIPHKEYAPPKLIVDKQTLEQVFLI